MNPRQNPQKQVVVLNSHLINGEIGRYLQEDETYRVRVTESTLKNTVIFPVQSISFLIMSFPEACKIWPPSGKQFLNESVVERIRKFSNIHRNAFVLVVAKLTTEAEFKVWKELQNIFWKTQLKFLPVSSLRHCVSIMMEIASTTVDKDMEAIYSELSEGRLSEEMISKILESNLTISPHQSLVLLDGCQNIANIASATKAELLDHSPLPKEVADKIQLYFEKDCVGL